jgi:hypothetical protein
MFVLRPWGEGRRSQARLSDQAVVSAGRTGGDDARFGEVVLKGVQPAGDLGDLVQLVHETGADQEDERREEQPP